MTTLKALQASPNITFSAAGDPTQSIVGARVTDVYLNSVSGEQFRCVDATFGSQVWEGSQGTRVPAAILATDHPNLVAMYTMDNISGSTLEDESPNNRDATIFGPTQVAGKIGNALDFETGDRTDSGSALALAAGSQGAVSIWVYPETNTNRHFLFCACNTASDVEHLALSVSGAMDVQLTSNSANQVNSQLLCTQNDWNHVVVQSGGSTWQIFVNGVESALTVTGSNTGDWYGDVNSVDNMTLGRLARLTPANTKPMKVDQARLFNRTLTQAEVTALYGEPNL